MNPTASATAGRSRGQLGVSVVGLGRWGRHLARVFGDVEGAVLRSVCDLDGARLAPVVGASRHLTDFHDVLIDRGVDAVVLATPASTQPILAIAAMEAGKHVLIEKPMALCSRDAARICEAAERYHRRAMVGFILQYHPAIELLARWVSEGVLGQLKLIRTTRCGSQGGPSDPGPWWSLAPHDINLVVSWLGEAPIAISAVRQPDTQQNPVHARLSFANECAAELVVGASAGVKMRRVVVIGTRGVAVFDDTRVREKLKFYDLTEEIPTTPAALDDALSQGAPAMVPGLPDREPLQVEAAHFIEGILRATPFRTEAVDGLRVVEVLQKGEESLAAQGRVLTLTTRHGRESVPQTLTSLP